MGRIIEKIKIRGDPQSSGNEVFAIYDTGTEWSYIRRSSIPSDIVCSPITRFKTKIGGVTHEITEMCGINGEIQGLSFDFKAYPLERVGIMEGKEVAVIIGATTMKEWDIILNPKKKILDLSALKRREFIEL